MKNYTSLIRITGVFFMLIFFVLKFGPFRTGLETAAFWVSFACFFVLGTRGLVSGIRYYIKA
ncbi:hypothetical protein ASG01_06185 [Chryseobacterium sp. Leaf180]|jgi:ribonucleotide reductase beta subunit family protein with ferritin-like domain|uniref:hypothetical protein n=1 Tax=Chryseobacterium sp. Leaf180 TaxID=1736289 RepID=UPI0006FBE7E1|nr:hypothetical protein [Chryseobacterium sp. Leaf180]KQR95430.1 hypothetical protein ASG01_06185 [Chryseobacterium sp. Leaf180]